MSFFSNLLPVPQSVFAIIICGICAVRRCAEGTMTPRMLQEDQWQTVYRVAEVCSLPLWYPARTVEQLNGVAFFICWA